MKKPNQPTKKPPRQTKKSQTHQKSQILVAFHNLCFILPQSTWPNSHWHPFVLPHPPKYSMVAARFEWVLNGAEGGDQVWLPWPPLPAPNFSRIIPFPTSSPCWCHPCAASGAPAGWAGQGELGKWAFFKMVFFTASDREPGRILIGILDDSGISGGFRGRSHFPAAFLCWDTKPAWIRGWRGWHAPAAPFPLVKMDFWSFANTAYELRQWTWAAVRFCVDIYVFVKKKVIISVFESIGPWVFQE